MSSVTRPSGPLPARTYWIRRALVLGVPVALIAVLVVWMSGGSDSKATDESAVAQQAAAEPTPTLEPTPTSNVTKKNKKSKKTVAPTPTVPAPPQPTGTCAATDVKVVPSVPSPIGGSDVLIGLALSTKKSPACTWTVSADSLALKVTSGNDDIWSSAECPTAIPTGDVVLTNTAATPISVTWPGRRSDEVCSVLTEWALPGFYHVQAAPLGGNPKDVQFELLAPEPEVVTSTIPPTATPGAPTDGAPTDGAPTDGATDGAGSTPGEQPTDNGETPNAEPSGAVEPTS